MSRDLFDHKNLDISPMVVNNFERVEYQSSKTLRKEGVE